MLTVEVYDGWGSVLPRVKGEELPPVGVRVLRPDLPSSDPSKTLELVTDEDYTRETKSPIYS